MLKEKSAKKDNRQNIHVFFKPYYSQCFLTQEEDGEIDDVYEVMDPDPDINLEEDMLKKVAGTATIQPGLSWTEEYDNDDGPERWPAHGALFITLCIHDNSRQEAERGGFASSLHK